MNRQGFAIAIDTLVLLILGFVIVAGGITLIWKITDKGSATYEGLTAEQEDVLRNMITRGQIVAIYPGSLTVEPGEGSNVALAIRNRLDADAQFDVAVSCFKEDSSPCAMTPWHLLQQPGRIKANEEALLPIVILPTADVPAGTYTYILEVLADGQAYGDKTFFFVTVE